MEQPDPVLPVALLKGLSITCSQGIVDCCGVGDGMGGEREEWCLEESSSVFLKCFIYFFLSIPKPVTKSSLIGNKLN